MRTPPRWIFVGALVGFLGVSLGAFGAHGLEKHVTAEGMAWWETGVRYHLVHAPVILLLGLLPGRLANRAGWSFLLGIFLFSGTLYAMALGAPRWFGAITPVGGVALLIGWTLLAMQGRHRAPTGA